MIDVHVVSAFAPELDALGLAPGAQRETERGIVRADTLGVGPLAAAATLGALLALHDARRVVFVGTAGVFPHARDRFPICTLALATRTSLVDVAELRGWSERPNVQIARFDLDVTPAAELGLAGSGAAVATVSGVTVDDSLARELGAAGFELEHLELAGVAAACLQRGVHCVSVLGISNVVGKDGRAEWRTNHVTAAAAACERLRSWLRL